MTDDELMRRWHEAWGRFQDLRAQFGKYDQRVGEAYDDWWAIVQAARRRMQH